MRRHLVAVVALSACAPRVRLSVIDAADVVLPDEVRTIAVVDRTGEPLGAGAAEGAAEAVARSGRFVLADAADADALVVVDAPSARSRTAIAPVNGAFEARLDAGVTVTWEVRSGDRVLDRLEEVGTVDTWFATGATEAEAAAGLPTVEAVEADLARSAGQACARRIAPRVERVVRDYYVRGDPRLRAARRAVRAGDWSRATATWLDVARSAPRAAVRSRAEYDLAVAFEVQGHYRRALGHAERAVTLDRGPRVVRYRDTLAAEIPLRRELVRDPRLAGLGPEGG